MTEQKQILTKQREKRLTARKKEYLSCIERYPLYSVLLVLSEYSNKEWYEECAIIKTALDEYNTTKVNTKKIKDITGPIIFPTSLDGYKSQNFQKVLRDYNIIVGEKVAKEKATLIKLKLPVNCIKL